MSLVKRFVHGEIENKRVGLNIDNAFNSTISAASECYNLLPPIAPNDGSGSGANERIGDRVKPRSLIVRGTVQYDSGYQGNFIPPSTVRCLILTQKNIKVGSDVGSRADVAHLLKDNVSGASARGYSGTAFDNHSPINTDLFKVLMDKKYTMVPQLYTGLGNSSDTNTKTLSGTQPTIHFVVKIPVPAKLTFDDGNGNYANNFAPFFCFGAVCDDGNSAFTLSAPYRVRVQSILDFEDA